MTNNNESGRCVLYADHSTFLLKRTNNNELREDVANTLPEIKFWFDTNGLKMNSAKTEIVKLQTQQCKHLFDQNIAFDSGILESTQINTLQTDKLKLSEFHFK